MKKNKSKKMKQLKYLLLIPVLTSMLFYISCSENDVNEVGSSKKELQTMYRNKDGVLKAQKGKKETYLDNFIGTEAPIGAKEITINDLSDNEREEYEIMMQKLNERRKDRPEIFKMFTFEFYNMPNGRKASAMLVNTDIFKEKVETRKISNKDGSVNFLAIDQAPTFPGCDEGDKDCFNTKIQKHFIKNFNKDLPNQLGLSSGRKRVFIGFKINSKGDVVDIKARAPHPEIENEVIRVMNNLPKMIPGENKEEKVAVNYNIPFVIEVK